MLPVLWWFGLGCVARALEAPLVACEGIEPYMMAQGKHLEAWSRLRNVTWRVEGQDQRDMDMIVLGNVARAVKALAKRSLSSDATDERPLLDVGANVGEVSLLFAEVFSGDDEVRKIFAFEGQKRVYDSLTSNLKASNATGRFVPVFHAASNVGDVIMTMYAPASKANRSTFTGSSFAGRASGPVVAVNDVATVRLDDWCRDLRPLFIKIDTEGFDAFVLDGMEELLSAKQVDVFIFEFNWSQWRLSLRQFGKNLSFFSPIDHARGLTGLKNAVRFMENRNYVAFGVTPTKLIRLSHGCWTKNFNRWHFTGNILGVQESLANRSVYFFITAIFFLGSSTTIGASPPNPSLSYGRRRKQTTSRNNHPTKSTYGLLSEKVNAKKYSGGWLNRHQHERGPRREESFG